MSRKYFRAAALAVACLALRAPEASFASSPRPPAMQGRFYPSAPAELSALVSELLTQARPSQLAGELVALLVPHAGLEFSGSTAAKAYKLLAKGRFDSVLIVGAGHRKLIDGAALYPGAYAAGPFVTSYDDELGRALVAASPLITIDAAAHESEHSIEVQIPFLVKRLGPVKTAALVMNSQDPETVSAVGLAIARVVRGKKVLLIASSDLSHYPSGAVADIVDRTTLEALATLDLGTFWLTNRLLLNRGLADLEVSYCGEGAVAAVMTAARELGATRTRVLGRLNSGDVVSERDYHHVVGYAAAAFIKYPRAQSPLAPALSSAEKKELLAMARGAIADTLRGKGAAPPDLSDNPRYNLPAALYVTLKDKAGEVRGCIGNPHPRESLAEAVADNAVSSAMRDSRFSPLTLEEMGEVRLEISLLSPLRPAVGLKEIRPPHGVFLENEGRSGLFLPQVWKKLPKREDFLSALCSEKAGLPRDCFKDPATKLKVFTVEIFEEN